MKLAGGCHCGAIRYVVDDTPFHETICYCSDCRRTSGAVSVAWFSVKRSALTWHGEPAAYRSSPHAIRRFCGTCGTSLTFEDDDSPDALDLSAATLDDPDLVPPKDHLFVSHKPGWQIIGDSLPRFARTRRESDPTL